MRDVIALIGLPGSGKSVASRILSKHGYFIVRLGDATDEEVKRRGLELNEENERRVRIDLRKRYGMEAYATLNINRVMEHEKVVIDGLRSFEEYLKFKAELGACFRVIAIDTDKRLRYGFLKNRKVRPLTEKECKARDLRELDALGMRKTLTVADITIENNGSIEELATKIKALI